MVVNALVVVKQLQSFCALTIYTMEEATLLLESMVMVLCFTHGSRLITTPPTFKFYVITATWLKDSTANAFITVFNDANHKNLIEIWF